ncbi:thymidylate kinase [Dyella monticola]|uniref:Thymidylate kinase n=1 Tax=Dyella monticola TaxID=1927958 RepID=A0A370X5X0_9GAMM|nr:thymidylate kinase [Dyella monticola]RDS83595.1 thymidylate kinase [Dyella monticola]
MSLLITFDGPKGVGKTTLVALVHQRLLAGGYTVEALVEKNLMDEMLGPPLGEAYKALKNSPGERSETYVADLHRRGRLLIGGRHLDSSQADIVLLDRWYPSEAVFRRHIDVVAAIDANLRDGVCVPDLAFAVTCTPEISWERAHSRERSLDSKVIFSLEEHRGSTFRFERLAKKYGWRLLRSEVAGSNELSDQVVAAIAAHS